MCSIIGNYHYLSLFYWRLLNHCADMLRSCPSCGKSRQPAIVGAWIPQAHYVVVHCLSISTNASLFLCRTMSRIPSSHLVLTAACHIVWYVAMVETCWCATLKPAAGKFMVRYHTERVNLHLGCQNEDFLKCTRYDALLSGAHGIISQDWVWLQPVGDAWDIVNIILVHCVLVQSFFAVVTNSKKRTNAYFTW